ncbi:MAG: DUF3757 domain-containing protein [Paludibacterium sp.]|uniref:DUF3757 domain-containing protein n=1 Tax=Paludibacterium sp. TaxID=1917523 RepID=UPI0025DAB440|nr:DUF3757 domain-containing protein [Paludibacterium sp.]MBV8046138.1 DUF3757 domain-containing protein [Paludibacterium sp.]MBV8648796.1 DUF3757 domain-containing protein [Paludibacterium sp.]
MQHKSMLWIWAGLATAPAWAETAAPCPFASNIEIRGAVYHAAAPGGGEWMGFASPGLPVRRFDKATFIAERDNALYGRQAKCSYELQQVGSIDLFLNPRQSEPPRIRMGNQSAWKSREHPLGVTYYECRKKDPSACAFLYTQP